MKLLVTVIVSLLVALATGMTFFVVTSFWLRESALGLAREKELAVIVRAEQYINHQQRPSEAEYVAALLEAGVKYGGAFSGCARLVEGKSICSGEALTMHQSALEGILAETVETRSNVRSLSGLEWFSFPPHKKYLDIGVYVAVPHLQGGAIALRYSLDAHYMAVRSLQRYIFGYLGINFIVLVVLGFFRFQEQLFRPLERLIRMTDSYKDESGVPFLAIQGGDELGQLSVSMQQMLARIKADRETMQRQVASLEAVNQQLVAAQEEMVRSEKLTSVGRLAAGLAHEIGNPIGIIQGYLSLLHRQDVSESERRDFCNRAEQELQRVSQLVRQLLDLARPANGVEEVIDAHQVLQEVVDLLRPQSLMTRIDVHTHLRAQKSLVYGIRPHLLQVLLNCLLNAADAIQANATDERGVVTIETLTQIKDSGQWLCITIADTGTGLSPEEAANAFDPFFTTKPPGKGTGLGLSVSYALIKAMGGEICLANREGGGAVLTIVLPIHQSDACHC